MQFQVNSSYIMISVHLPILFMSQFYIYFCEVFHLSHRLLSHINIAETMESGEAGASSVASAMTNPLKEIDLTEDSNQ